MKRQTFLTVFTILMAILVFEGCHTQFTIRTADVRNAILGGNDAGLAIRNNTPVKADIQAGPFQFLVEPGSSAYISYRASFYASRSLHMEVTATPDVTRVGKIRSAKMSWDYSQWYNDGSWSVVDQRVIVLELSEDGKEFYFR